MQILVLSLIVFQSNAFTAPATVRLAIVRTNEVKNQPQKSWRLRDKFVSLGLQATEQDGGNRVSNYTGVESFLAADLGGVAILNKNVDETLAISQQEIDAADATETSPSILQRQESNSPNPTHDNALDLMDTTIGIDAPSVRKILTFAIPAIGVWLCNPLLSLIDTSAVGILSGTAQLAALNPAAAITNYAALLIAFMYTGTTNLVAGAQEADLGKPDKPNATRAFVTALQLSTWVGATLGAVLLIFARPLLMALIGNDAIAPDVFLAAMRYVRIRALGMPAATIIGSAQAGCLGLQDIKSPLYVLLAAAVVNFCGDALLVWNTNPWIGGAAGAAWATVFSQYVALYLFTHWLCNHPKYTKQEMDLTSTSTETNGDGTIDRKKNKEGGLASVFRRFSKDKKDAIQKRTTSFSSRGMLKGRFVGMDYLRFPMRKDAREFKPYFLPVTSTQVGRVSSHIAMSHVVASCMGTVGMAAQQVVVSLFYCLTPISESLSLTAQSFVPTIFQKKPSKERSDALRTTALNFGKAGAAASAAMMSIVMCIPFMTKLFSADPAVRAMVNSVTHLLLAFFGVHGFVAAGEGVLMGQRDLPFLGKMYAGFFVVVPYLMLRVKKAAIAGQSVDLRSVWTVFLCFQMFRVTAWLGRQAQLQLRTERKSTMQNKSI